MKYVAYFISPYGEIIPVEYNHSDTIYKNPEIFGLTLDYVKGVYDKYKEPYNFDGKAKHEIVFALQKRGWVRIRWVYKRYAFTIDFYKLSRRTKEGIWDWANKMMNGELDNISGMEEAILLDGYLQEATKVLIRDLVKGKVLFETTKKYNGKLKILKVDKYGKIIKK